MSLDLRPLTTNATQQTLQAIMDDHAIRTEILWSFIILLHFAALLPLNPVLVHVFVVFLTWATSKAQPGFDQRFYARLSERLTLDSGIGVKPI
ncbi:hypothetical protein B0A48_14656 [Cryoendolithus antarcticus]|uniref:Uncharacterized protein n=1 Tax=Cryoendolithus antarcticus TaxID=1507870 RepID=A0A1V8SK23_9PEZI|nr:hypothetical protein B0A48_14656 [Cryoendolithus antarcticus]